MTEYSERVVSTLEHRLAWCLGLGLSAFHIYLAWDPMLSEFARNAMHFGGFVLLASLVKPTGFAGDRWLRFFDYGLALGAVWACWHVVTSETAIYERGVRLEFLDWLAIGWLIFCAVEYSRRVAGWIVPALILLALSYISFWGAHIPGVFRFAGLSLETLAFRSVYGDDGLFGTIARISSTYVFVFIVFGSFLVRSGAGEFVIDLSRALAGRVQGGPGFVAVLSSGLTGTISGSAVANTASTGVITIPMMKRAGFPAPFAGAVEASASTGGQLMPPIMGAGAFVMAAYTQIPYESIALAAAIPAFLYFASVIFFVRIQARKLNLQGMEGEGLTLKQAFKQGGASFIIPVGLLITLLASGFTPTYAAVFSILAIIVSSHLTLRPMGFYDVLDALALGAKNMIMTAVLLCSVGLIVNVIATAGIGNTFSLMISNWSDGSVIIAIGLIAIASLVLGMGLPVTAAYIVLATLSAPALAGMIADQAALVALAGELSVDVMPIVQLAMPTWTPGLESAVLGQMWADTAPELKSLIRDSVVNADQLTAALLAAHMIIFWLSQDSNVTPPVCLAAFTAAAIAKSRPMYTGFVSWKLAKGLYIVPVLFAYTPLLSGDGWLALSTGATALIGIYLLAGSMEGWLEQPLGISGRVLAGLSGVALMWPGLNLAWGGAGVLFIVGQQLLATRRSAL